MFILEMVLSFFTGIILVSLFAIAFNISLKLLLKILISSAIGGLLCFYLAIIGLELIPVGTFTSFLTGFLGIPALLIILLLNIIL